MKENAVMI